MNGNRVKSFIWLILVIFVFLLPVIVRQDDYILHVGITIAFNIAMATSLWFLWSLGYVSFAHAGFMGIGAYTSALLFLRLGWSLWATMWIGAALAGIIACVVSIPLMRTKAVYFFMASWAVGEVIKMMFALKYFRWFTGGWDGLFDILPPKLSILGLYIDFSSRVAYYYLAVMFAVAIVFIIYRLNQSRIGTILWSIHESEALAEHAGIHLLRYKVLTFTVVCFFAGLTGALFAHYHTFISPRTFDIWVSEFTLVHVIVGGLATVAGPVAGATVLTILDELLRPLGFYRVVIFGVILILTVLFLPEGLESIPGRIRSLIRRVLKQERRFREDATT